MPPVNDGGVRCAGDIGTGLDRAGLGGRRKGSGGSTDGCSGLGILRHGLIYSQTACHHDAESLAKAAANASAAQADEEARREKLARKEEKRRLAAERRARRAEEIAQDKIARARQPRPQWASRSAWKMDLGPITYYFAVGKAAFPASVSVTPQETPSAFGRPLDWWYDELAGTFYTLVVEAR